MIDAASHLSSVLLVVAAASVLRVLFGVIARRRATSLAFLVGAPTLVVTVAIMRGVTEWALLAKVLSVLAGVGAVHICRFTRLGRNRRVLQAAEWIFYINILEPASYDATQASAPHLWNAAAGALLVLSALSVEGLEPKAAETGVLWNVPRAWILLYTIWDWLFIVLNWPELGPLHAAVLLAPLLFRSSEQWVEARVYTLAIYLTAHFVLPDRLFSALSQGANIPWVRSLPPFVAAALFAYLARHLVPRIQRTQTND